MSGVNLKPNVKIDAQTLMEIHGFDSLSKLVTALIEGLSAFHGTNSEPVMFVLVPVEFDMFASFRTKYGNNAGVKLKKIIYDIIESEVTQ